MADNWASELLRVLAAAGLIVVVVPGLIGLMLYHTYHLWQGKRDQQQHRIAQHSVTVEVD